MSNAEVKSDSVASAERRDRRSKRGRRILALILFVLFLLLITVSVFLVKIVAPKGGVATVKETNGLTWVRSIYGWGPAKDQQLGNPAGVAVGPDGTIWTTNQATHSVIGFNPDGTFKMQLKGTAKDPLQTPTQVAADNSGRLYVVANPLDNVHVITQQDQEVFNLRVQKPTAIAVSNDRVVIGSEAGFAILDKQGKVLKIIGTRGKGIDQFDTVNGLAIAKNGTIYVSDTFNNRVSAYDPQGRRLWIVSTGHPGNAVSIRGAASQASTTSAPAKLQIPTMLTLDGRGRIVIVDPFDFSLTVLNSKDGSFLGKYGAFGHEDGQFYYPSGLSYDPARDWFVVSDSANNRLEIVRLPNSGTSTAGSALSRALSGPLRACFVPLILLLIAIVLALLNRRRKKRMVKAPVQPEGANADTSAVEANEPTRDSSV